MKIKPFYLILFISVLCSVQKVNAQNWSWARGSQYNTSTISSHEASYTNASGNTVITGGYSDSIKIGNKKLVNKGFTKFYIGIIDPNGNLLQLFSDGQMGLEDAAYINEVTMDKEQNIIIVGEYFSDSILFGGTYYSGFQKLFIIKYKSNGELLWANFFGVNLSDNADAVSQVVVDDRDNSNIYVVGHFRDSTLNLGSISLPSTGVLNTFLIKYSSDGDVLWAKTATVACNNEFQLSRGFTVALSSDAVYWLGSFIGTFTINGETIGSVDALSEDVYIVSLSKTGAVNWIKQDGAEATSDFVENAVVLADTMLLVVGFYQGGSSSFAGYSLPYISDPDYVISPFFIAAYNTSDGTGKWSKSVLIPTIDMTVFPFGDIWDLELDSELNAWLYGRFRGGVYFDGQLESSKNNLQDLFLLKYNTQSAQLMSKYFFGANENENSASLGIDACDQLYCFGEFSVETLFGEQMLSSSNIYRQSFLSKFETNTQECVLPPPPPILDPVVENKDTYFFIPNLFTPNGDGYNEAFYCSTNIDFSDIHMFVYNQWGALVYEEHSKKPAWNGENSAYGVYYYLITTTYLGEEKSYKGIVSLVK